MRVAIALAGRMAVEIDGTTADDARLGRLGRLALAYLVLERSRPVPRDELADVLWGEDLPPTWDAALRGVVSRVRAVLAAALVAAGLPADEVVRGELGCYQLCLPSEPAVDVEEAAAELATALRWVGTEPEGARRLAAKAEATAARQFLPGASGGWVERRQTELADVRLRALEVVSQAAAATDDHAGAATAAEQAVALAPLRESAYQRLMEAHAGAGNRTAALRAYERCRSVLAEELGVSPSAATDAAYVRLLGDEPVDDTSRGPRTNLPAPTSSFVGRAEQVAALTAQLCRGTRLLTLTGPGGVGKSRLALVVASPLLADNPDGVWLVELAGISDPALVAVEVLSVLGVPEATGSTATETLARRLANQRLLLVLDNCEHLVSACATLVEALLRSCPNLLVLATSREPLGVSGEVTWPVTPLTVPPAGDEAVRLFADRARAAAPGADLDADLVAAAGDVQLICERLDGIPLAIELAAARTRALSVAEVARRLDHRLQLLVGGPRTAPARHQTLRAAIDWSFEALSENERRLFLRLSVFAGGFRLEAAEWVGKGLGALAALASLVDKSLVIAERSGGTIRYRMLETLRQYGAERLADDEGGAEVASDARARHLDWASALGEHAGPGLEGPDQAKWLAVLDEEQDNLRAALDWAAATGDTDRGLQLASALVRFWEIRGYLSEGRARLEFWAGRDDGPPALRAKALNAVAVLAQRQRDNPAARAFYQESLVTRRALGDELGAAVALHGLANLAVADDDLVTARALFEENLAIARRLEEPRMVAASLMNLGVVAHYTCVRSWPPNEPVGREAERFYEQSLVAYRDLGDRYGVALALENLGSLGPTLGELEISLARHEEAMAIRRELGDKMGIAASARFLAYRAYGNGMTATARELHEERLVINRELGNTDQVAETLTALGEIAAADGDFGEARELLDESQSCYAKIGDRGARCRVLGSLADVFRRQGDLGRARSTLDSAWQLATDLQNEGHQARLTFLRARLARSAGNPRAAVLAARDALDRCVRHDMTWAEADVLDLLGGLAAEDHELSRTARLLGAAERLRRPSNTVPRPRPADAEYEHDVAAARAALGDDLFTAAWQDGAEMTDDARRAYARGVGGENDG